MKNIIGRESIYTSDYSPPPYMCRSVAMNNTKSIKKLEEPRPMKPQIFYDSETFAALDSRVYVPMDLLWEPKEILRTNPGDKFINPYLYKKSYDDAEEVDRPHVYMSPAVCLDKLPPPERAQLCEKIYRSTWNARGEPPSIVNAQTKCLSYKKQQFTTVNERPGDYVKKRLFRQK